MSAFLGPVHHGMYQKIQLQEAFTAQLVMLSKDNALSKHLDKEFGVLDTLPLEKIIDQSNIHGWLSGRVERAEERFSNAISALLIEFGGTLDTLVILAKKIGSTHSVPRGTNVLAAYQAIDKLMLDGMPCDGGRQVISEESDTLTFQYDVALHALCNKGKTEQAAFMELREAFVRGMFVDTKLKLIPLGEGLYKITMED